MKFNVLVASLLLVYSTSNAQLLGKIGADRFVFRVSSNKALYYGQPGNEIVGTPYLEDNFIFGSVSIDKGTHADIPLRYNIYDDKVEFKQKEVIYELDPDVRIKKIIFGGHILTVEKFEYKWKTQDGYLILLDSGKLTLLSKKVVSFKERQEPRAMESTITPAKFSRLSDVFYYKVGNGKLQKLESIKAMIGTLPDKQKEVSEFAKKEKISPKKETELIKLVKYYNSL